MKATIIRWLKTEGDTILEAESIVEVATDKVDSEIPAPYTGKIKRILVKVGDVVAVGNPIAVIETENLILEQDSAATSHVQDISSSQLLTYEKPKQIVRPDIFTDTSNSWPLYDLKGRFLSPLVRLMAQKELLPLEEIENIPGTGKDKRKLVQLQQCRLCNCYAHRSSQARRTSHDSR